MTVKITRESESSDRFFLGDMIGGFQLTVDCSEQLAGYNKNHSDLTKYSHLIKSFSEANDAQTLRPLINEFNGHFWLHRNPVFKDDQFAPILAEYIDKIRDTDEASAGSIDLICGKFKKFGERFSCDLQRPTDKPLPDVSLSKLLHCIRPNSYWILDNRVCSVLGFWGYRDTYCGFGDFLKDLFKAPEFGSFKASLEEKNRQTAGDHSSCSFLKLLDTVLWFRP